MIDLCHFIEPGRCRLDTLAHQRRDDTVSEGVFCSCIPGRALIVTSYGPVVVVIIAMFTTALELYYSSANKTVIRDLVTTYAILILIVGNIILALSFFYAIDPHGLNLGRLLFNEQINQLLESPYSTAIIAGVGYRSLLYFSIWEHPEKKKSIGLGTFYSGALQYLITRHSSIMTERLRDEYLDVVPQNIKKMHLEVLIDIVKRHTQNDKVIKRKIKNRTHLVDAENEIKKTEKEHQTNRLEPCRLDRPTLNQHSLILYQAVRTYLTKKEAKKYIHRDFSQRAEERGNL